jgi:hypothetical protein
MQISATMHSSTASIELMSMSAWARAVPANSRIPKLLHRQQQSARARIISASLCCFDYHIKRMTSASDDVWKSAVSSAIRCAFTELTGPAMNIRSAR